MQNSHLPAFDFGSMRASFELRSPFLNRKIMDTVASFDPRIFIAFGQKYILRKLLKRYLPDEFIDSRKLGFAFPGDQFLKNNEIGTPAIKSLSGSVIRDAWQQRETNKGWGRIAIRLILLSEFLAAYTDN